MLTFTKRWPSTVTHFSVSTHHTFLRRVLNCSLIAMCKVPKQFFFRRTHRRMRKKDVVSATECTAPNLFMALSSGLAILFFFHSPNPCIGWGWSKPSDCSNFEGEKTLARRTLNFYDVQCTPAKWRSPWGRIGKTPSNQPISELDMFSKCQALSWAVAVNGNMSRGKYLAREGPGSR